MRKILFTLSLFLCLGCFAQKPLEYSKVIQVENSSAGDIYNTAKKWIVKNFRDANSVIEFDNPQDNEFTGKGNFDFVVNSLTWNALTGHISFSINIKAKDGRFKVILADFRHFANINKQWDMGLICETAPEKANKGYRKMLEKSLPLCEAKANEMFTSLEDYCKKDAVEEDNW